MATATITMQSVCAGGDHVKLRLTVGAQNFDFDYHIDELREAITAEQRRDAVSVMTRFHCGGMTKAEAKAELSSPGIVVTTA